MVLMKYSRLDRKIGTFFHKTTYCYQIRAFNKLIIFQMLAKCYGDGVTDDWTIFTDKIYKDCYAQENNYTTPQTRVRHLHR